MLMLLPRLALLSLYTHMLAALCDIQRHNTRCFRYADVVCRLRRCRYTIRFTLPLLRRAVLLYAYVERFDAARALIRRRLRCRITDMMLLDTPILPYASAPRLIYDMFTLSARLR